MTAVVSVDRIPSNTLTPIGNIGYIKPAEKKADLPAFKIELLFLEK